MNELAEKITDLLVGHFIKKNGGLLIEPGYSTSKDQIHLIIGEETIACEKEIDTESLMEALKKAYENILTIAGIPEVVESIQDLDDHFRVNLATVH